MLVLMARAKVRGECVEFSCVWSNLDIELCAGDLCRKNVSKGPPVSYLKS